MSRGTLEKALRKRRDAGRKLLVAYVTGGLGRDWLDVVRAIGAAGADAIEIGIPFSDPVMDGPIIQQASAAALKSGATPSGIIAALARADTGVPLAVMTYYNVVFRAGHRRMAGTLADAGVSGAIVPDLPIDELDGWGEEAERVGVETVLLVAPTTPERRLGAICARSRGFVYGVGVMGVTGERESVSASALTVAAALQERDGHPGAHWRRDLQCGAGSRGCRNRRWRGGRIRARPSAPQRRGSQRCGGVRGGAAGGDRPLSSAPGGIFFRGLKGARTVGYPVLIERRRVRRSRTRSPCVTWGENCGFIVT